MIEVNIRETFYTCTCVFSNYRGLLSRPSVYKNWIIKLFVMASTKYEYTCTVHSIRNKELLAHFVKWLLKQRIFREILICQNSFTISQSEYYSHFSSRSARAVNKKTSKIVYEYYDRHCAVSLLRQFTHINLHKPSKNGITKKNSPLQTHDDDTFECSCYRAFLNGR